MKKKILTTLTLLTIAFSAGAQGTTTTGTTTPAKTRQEIKKGVQGEIRTLKQDTKTEIQDIKKTFQEETRSLKDTLKTQVRLKSASLTPAEIKAKREGVRKEIETKREELQERVRAEREELRVRLQKIKDEQKKQRVERIADSVDALNVRLTDHYLDVIEKMEKSLERITKRANRAESRGLDVSVVRAAVDGAHQAIEESRAAIAEQAGKTYAIPITTEGALKADVGKARKALHDDLARVRDTVKKAHDAVRNAAVILAQIPRIDEDGVATSTPPAAPPAPPATPPAPPATSTPPAPPASTSTETPPPPTPPSNGTSTATSS